MKKVALSIDTSSREAIRVAVEIDGKRFEKVSVAQGTNAQMVLPMLEELLREHGLTVLDIDRMNVHAGPGSFTGLRVGVAIANALSWLLTVPINNKPQGSFVVPVYV